MAVVNLTTYKSTDNTPVDAIKVAGSDMLIVVAKASITSGNSSGSIYRIAEIPTHPITRNGMPATGSSGIAKPYTPWLRKPYHWIRIRRRFMKTAA